MSSLRLPNRPVVPRNKDSHPNQDLPSDLADRLARAIEGSTDGIWDWDLVTGELFLSGRAQWLFGASPGRSVRTMDEWQRHITIHPDDDAFHSNVLESFASREPLQEGQWRALQPDGEFRWVKFRGVCFRDANGRPVRAAGSVSDMDAQIRAEEALRASEERFALAVLGSSDGIWDWSIDKDEMFMSERAQALYGLTPGPDTRRREEWRAAIQLHPDDVPHQLQSVEGHLAGGPAYDGHWRVLHQDGQYRWVRIRGICERDAAGRALRLAGSVSDVDAQIKTEAALRTSEERFVLAVAGSQDGIWDWDVERDHMFLSERAQALLGLEISCPAAASRQWFRLMRFHPDDAANAKQSLIACVRGGGNFDGKWRVIFADGSQHWVRVRGIGQVRSDGRSARIAGSISDVSALVKAENSLAQTRKLEALGTLAGGIAHDFNNILAAILGYAELLQRDLPSDGQAHADVQRITVAGERGRALVERILTFSRSSASTRAPVRVRDVIAESIAMVKATLPSNVQLASRLDASDALCLCDPTQIHQLFMNLASNAVQVLPTGGAVNVGLDLVHVPSKDGMSPRSNTKEGFIRLTVADDGPGIAEDVLQRIFDPFFTTRGGRGGTGLGLSLVHGIVTDLGGEIEVSTKVGEGSCFTVLLPRHRDGRADPEASARDASDPSDGRRLLVVDDEATLVDLLRRVLTSAGYQVDCFNNSQAALQAFEAKPEQYDLVITDERMPGLSGVQLIRAIKGIRQDLPVVMLSGHVDASTAEAAGLAGVDRIMKKPASIHAIAATVEDLFSPTQSNDPTLG